MKIGGGGGGLRTRDHSGLYVAHMNVVCIPPVDNAVCRRSSPVILNTVAKSGKGFAADYCS